MADQNSIKFGVDIDTKSANSALDSLRKKLQSAGDVKISAKGGLSDLAKGLESLKKQASDFGNALKRAAGPSLKAFAQAMKTAFLAIAAAAAAAGAAVAAAFGAALKKGVAGNSGLEDLQTGVAATVSSLYDLRDASGAPLQGLQRFEAAAAQAKQRLAQLRKETADTGYAMEDLGAALNTGMGLGAAAGIDADSVQELVRDISIASTAVGVAGADLMKEVKALFAGQGLEESKLARALAIDSTTLQSWRTQGTLTQELNKRLSDVKATALAAEQGMGQLQGRMAANVQNALTGATAGAYETIKKSLSEALDKLFTSDGEVAQRYRVLYEWAMKLFDSMAKGFAAGVKLAIDKLGGIADWMTANESAIKAIGGSFEGMAKSITGIGAPLKDMSSQLESAGTFADTLRVAFEMAERAVAALADVADVAFGAVQLGVAAILKGLADIGKLGGKIPGLEGLGESAGKLGEAAEKMGSAGAEMVASGITLKRSIQTAADISKRERERIDTFLKGMQVPSTSTAPPTAPETAPNVAPKADADAALKAQAAAAAKAVADAHAKAQAMITAATEAADKQRIASSRALAEAELERAAKLEGKSRKDVIDARLALEKDGLEKERAQAVSAQKRLQLALKDAVGEEAQAQLKAQLIAVDEQLKAIEDKERIVKIKAKLDTAALEGEIASLKSQLEGELRSIQGKAESLEGKRDSAKSSPLVNGNGELERLIDRIYSEEKTHRDFEQQIEDIARIRQEQVDAEEAIEEQYSASQITSLEREEQLARVRGESVEKLREASTAMGDLAAASEDVALAEQVAELNKELSKAGKQISEVNKQIVNELKSDFQSTFTDITRGTKSFADGMMDLFTNLLGRIADEFAKKGFESLFASAGGAGASGGWLGTLVSWMGGAVQQKATGGVVTGAGTGTSDSIPALLSNGEYVVRASAARKHMNLLSYMNQTGNLPSGIGGSVPRDMGGAGQFNNTVNVSPQVVIQTGQLIDALRGDSGFERTLVQIVSANKARLGIK